MANHEDERELWNKRYRSGEHPRRENPSQLLKNSVQWLPNGRALDLATGTGRHALFLAERGYKVDAVDISEEGLEIARQREEDRGLDVNWIQADLESFVLPKHHYDVVNVVGYYGPNLIPGFKDSLRNGGVILYKHHLGPAEIAERGPSDQFRYQSNELLHSFKDLTVLDYRERNHVYKDDDVDPKVSLIARKGLDDEPWYPPER